MPVLIVLAAIFLLVTALVVMRRVDGARRLPAWTHTVHQAHDKIRAGQAVDVVVEYSTRYDLGSRSPETILNLLLGMTNTGHLHKATHLLGPARAILAEHALFEHSATRELCHALRLALAEVEMAGGQFIPAAQTLIEFAEDSVYPDQALALAALSYYLSGERQSAQALLERIRPYELRPVDKPSARPSRSFQVITLYLRHRLLVEDNFDRLRELASVQLDPWTEWAENAAPTTYGSCLKELLDDVGTYTLRSAPWHSKTVERLKRGEADIVIGEALAEDRTLVNLLMLVMAHVYRGEGDAAESHALAALEEAQRRGIYESGARQSIGYCELLDVALADVRQVQGHFAESGEILASHVNNAIRPNAMRAFAAWPFFLAGDHERVRTLLNQLDRVSQWNRFTEISPKYLFMVLYMGHVVLGVDTHTQMKKLTAEQLPAWEDEASRNAGNPYGARLAAILDDLKQWLQTG